MARSTSGQRAYGENGANNTRRADDGGLRHLAGNRVGCCQTVPVGLN